MQIQVYTPDNWKAHGDARIYAPCNYNLDKEASSKQAPILRYNDLINGRSVAAIQRPSNINISGTILSVIDRESLKTWVVRSCQMVYATGIVLLPLLVTVKSNYGPIRPTRSINYDYLNNTSYDLQIRHILRTIPSFVVVLMVEEITFILSRTNVTHL